MRRGIIIKGIKKGGKNMGNFLLPFFLSLYKWRIGKTKNRVIKANRKYQRISKIVWKTVKTVEIYKAKNVIFKIIYDATTKWKDFRVIEIGKRWKMNVSLGWFEAKEKRIPVRVCEYAEENSSVIVRSQQKTIRRYRSSCTVKDSSESIDIYSANTQKNCLTAKSNSLLVLLEC